MHPGYLNPKYKILKLENPCDPPNDCENEWFAWIDKRISQGKRHYPSERGLSLAKNRLLTFSMGQRGYSSTELIRYMLEKSEDRGWDGIFPLNEGDFQILDAMKPKQSQSNDMDIAP
jgi:hypothetical protein